MKAPSRAHPVRFALTHLTKAALLVVTLAGARAQDATPTPSKLTAARVQELVQAAGTEYGVTGLAVAVVQDKAILAEVAYGEAAAGKPMTVKTLTNIASCSKAFTATAVAMCVEDKLLAWDDLVIDHLPEFRMSDPWITAHMTIRDLLCHRCGLATFAGDLLWYGSSYDDDEVIRRLAKLPITQPFRGKFGYQNLMYLVAGKVIERKTGQTWSDFVQKRILTQLGMNQSRPDAQSVSTDADRALPHIDGKVVKDHVFEACKPAASIYSSAHELTIWMRALMAGGAWKGKRLISPASLIEMWRPHINTAPNGSASRTDDFASYGLGWFLTIDRGNKVVEHDGGMPGFLSKVSMIPGKRFGFVLLNNGNDGIVNEALKRALYAEYAGEDGMKILKRIAGIKQRIDANAAAAVKQRESKRREGTSPSHDLKHFAGDYEDEIYGGAKVTLNDGELSLVLVPAKDRIYGKMKHWHDNTFRVDFPDTFLPFALVSFKLDSQSNIASFKIDCPIADFDFGALDFLRKS